MIFSPEKFQVKILGPETVPPAEMIDNHQNRKIIFSVMAVDKHAAETSSYFPSGVKAEEGVKKRVM